MPERQPINLPQAIKDYAIQLATDHSQNSWDIGDFCIDVIDEFSTVYSKGAIRSSLAEVSKLNTETLRDRERISRKIPESKRTYYPLLYSQYRACLSAGDRWEEYARWAVESMDEYGGNPPSVVVIRAHIKGAGDEAPYWPKRIEKMMTLCEDMINDEKAPDLVKSEAGKIMRMLATLA